MKKKKCVAMILAGGQGSRLLALTSTLAKPAVSFGSKYRIIDFVLSNCANSGIDTVGVCTQYQPLILSDYIGAGEPWDLDRQSGGVNILSPYQAKCGGEWYKGTANAIYQNMSFLNAYDSDNVVILGGDHIYKMDYSVMLAHHKKYDADVTIAVYEVPWNEAPRFGIMSYDKSYNVTGFEEKPEKPKSNFASMGIYIFKKEVLVRLLEEDEADKTSSNDFGKNIIPSALEQKLKVIAYEYSGYWMDVGTLRSLWDANMDLLGGKPKIDLYDNWKIYSRNKPLPPAYLGGDGSVINSLITAGDSVHGKVINSVIGEGVTIGRGSVVQNSIIMRGSAIGDNVTIHYGIVDENVRIGDDCVIGSSSDGADKLTLIGRDSVVASGTNVAAGTVVEVQS